jgi:hypothetical protein
MSDVTIAGYDAGFPRSYVSMDDDIGLRVPRPSKAHEAG